ncbi:MULTISPECIES: DEAD/DEAH box helicase [Corynebacterium]|uniref:DEAD/DEAH box helicase n=1 Tax=Corynebacterium TaxID=1716 RepID=UPI001CE421E1|nr:MULTISPECIES: DEAD/DEAH box helicase [Corynebacterium]
MNIDTESLENLIGSVHSAIQHREATQFRLTTIAQGGTPPTIGSDDDTRVFAFGPTVETAAYVAQFRNLDIGTLRKDLDEVVLPSYTELEEMATEARKVPRYRGLTKLFSRRPVHGEQAIAQLQAIDVEAIHAILGGIDAKLGSTPTHEFTNLGLPKLTSEIEADLERITGWPITWSTPEVVNAHADHVARIDASRAIGHTLEAEVHRAGRQLALSQAEAIIAQTDISVIDQITGGRLRLGPLQHLTLRQIARSSASELQKYDGVGQKTASQAIAAARSYCADVVDSQVPKIDYQDKGPSTPYVIALARLLTFRDSLRDLPTSPMHIARVEPGTLVAVAGNNDLLDSTTPTVSAPPMLSAEDAWNLYAIRAAEFHSFGDSETETDVPHDIAERIADITLNGTLHASLRGYQAFGAKYALAQKRVLIGDEMGLGKTMQALAVITHLASSGKTKALVVCPPSLRINWAREIAKFTDLSPMILHGPDKESTYEAWKLKGGVAIAGFPEVRRNADLTGPVEGGGAGVDVLVVDEAHRAKNTASLQSQGVKALANKVEHCVFMTGTPLENRVGEFETLLSYLHPDIVDDLEKARGKPHSFKQAIAHVYLRRNQKDVLDELPPVTEIEEWIEAKSAERQRYNNAVHRGHFMDMRKAFAGRESAKMERVSELLDDGAEAGKTIIFTYFRSVLDELMELLGDRAFGPIAGGVSHEERQKAVDDFTAAETGAVLVAQITAASEGLNIQAANRIILFEPQLNPAVEAQAIARAHRMGQINTVEVHRLLTPDSVEERLMMMLENKRELFDHFARESVAADSNPEALDVSEAKLIEEVIAAERARIGEPDTLEEDTLGGE